MLKEPELKEGESFRDATATYQPEDYWIQQVMGYIPHCPGRQYHTISRATTLVSNSLH